MASRSQGGIAPGGAVEGGAPAGGAPSGGVVGTVVGDVPADQAQSQADIGQETEASKAAKILERKQFHEFAKSLKKNGKRAHKFEFKHLDAGEQAALLTELPASNWRNYP